MNLWYWQVIAGLVGCFVYYVRRYDPKLAFGFTEYLRLELMALIKGLIGFGGVYVLWVYGEPLINCVLDLAGLIIPSLKGVVIQLPPLYAPVWLIFGFAGKPIYDTVPRLFSYLAGFVKRRFEKLAP